MSTAARIALGFVVAAMAFGARLARFVRLRASEESLPANTESYNTSSPELNA